MDPARVLLALYLLFVVAAGARSVMQLAAHPGRAPVAYALSAAAAVVYLIGLVLVRRAVRAGGTRALTVCSVAELAGVLAVGTVSVADPGAFPDATVWSYYGAGYLCLPLVLPVAVLWWVRHTAHGRPSAMR